MKDSALESWDMLLISEAGEHIPSGANSKTVVWSSLRDGV